MGDIKNMGSLEVQNIKVDALLLANILCGKEGETIKGLLRYINYLEGNLKEIDPEN